MFYFIVPGNAFLVILGQVIIFSLPQFPFVSVLRMENFVTTKATLYRNIHLDQL